MICKNCNKEYVYKNGKSKEFCSSKCSILWKKENYGIKEIHICKNCNKEYEYIVGQKDWEKEKYKNKVRAKDFCCFECGLKYKKKKIDETNLEKYGRINVGQFGTEEHNNSMIEKYGRINVGQFGTEEHNNSMIEKYGTIHALLIKKIKNKKDETNLERYGRINVGQFGTEEHKESILKKYGVYNVSQNEEIYNKIKSTNIKKYGKPYPLQNEYSKNNLKNTNIKKYGVDNYSKTKEFKDLYKDENYVKNVVYKNYKTKKENNTFNTSKPEEKIYELLRKKFKKVERQYKSEKYPFACDFYIEDTDTYIEYQGNWTHGNEPFDISNQKHIKILNDWEQKSKDINFKQETKKYYENAIKVWSIFDPLKRKVAKENKLNWREFFNLKQFIDWFEQQ